LHVLAHQLRQPVRAEAFTRVREEQGAVVDGGGAVSGLAIEAFVP